MSNPDSAIPVPFANSSLTSKALMRKVADAWIWVFPILWTVFIATALWWNLRHTQRTIIDLARVAARSSFEKDIIYRQWAAMHGGVYVPATEKTPPNPYLSSVPEWKITAPSGRLLTLMNPAYMTRQVHELGRELFKHYSHITSLKPIRPENAPDEWERQALEAFERGGQEVSSVEAIKDKPHLRLMKPLITNASCLKCHAAQGYREGDIRGGISVAVPMKEYEAVELPHQRAELLAHGGIWGLGLTVFAAGARYVRKRRRERDAAIGALKKGETRFKAIFEDSPIAIWEEDFTQGKARMDELRRSGVADLRLYLNEHPEEVRSLAEKVRVVEINQTSVGAFGARNKAEVVRELPSYFTAESMEVFKEEMIALAEGRTHWSTEAPLIVAGNPVVFELSLSVQQGHEETLSSVLVSFMDITQRKRADAALQKHAMDLQMRNEELARFNRAATGRELRMIELKQEVNELCRLTDQPARYSLDYIDSEPKQSS